MSAPKTVAEARAAVARLMACSPEVDEALDAFAAAVRAEALEGAARQLVAYADGTGSDAPVYRDAAREDRREIVALIVEAAWNTGYRDAAREVRALAAKVTP